MYRSSFLAFSVAGSACVCALLMSHENTTGLLVFAGVLALAGLALCLETILAHATDAICYEMRETRREVNRLADLTRRVADANSNAIALRRRHVELLETMVRPKGAE